MGSSFGIASEKLTEAVIELFGADPRVRSVGIGRSGDSYLYRAVRNSAIVMPMNVQPAAPSHIHDIPVVFVDTSGEVESLSLVENVVPADLMATSLHEEVKQHRPLFSGLQIQNADHDHRSRDGGRLKNGVITIGTLGCFVKRTDGQFSLLSNNHVVAGENGGQRGTDRIAQPGSAVTTDGHIAVLHEFAQILFSPQGASPRTGNAVLNTVDAGIATLLGGVDFRPGYAPHHGLPAVHGAVEAEDGDRVFKVGRTTGLTWGTVASIATTVGPVGFHSGLAWFRDSIEVEGEAGVPFSAPGDSGSVVIRESGEIIGLLYAGNGQVTYACPIQAVLTAMGCSLA